jgi:O-antigen/teichoic acid export membrane protein
MAACEEYSTTAHRGDEETSVVGMMMADLAMPVTTSADAISMRHAKVARARRWAIKGVFAIVDQGFISGSNFVMGILLARWLGQDQYGAYALAFTIFILLSLVYQSLLLEPMSVYGPSSYREQLREYTGQLIWIHLVIAVATFVVMGAAALAMTRLHPSGALAPALMGAAIAAPCVLLFWLVRRVYYLRVAPGQAAAGAVLYCGMLFSSLAWLWRSGRVSPATAYVAMALAAVATSAFLFARFRPRFHRTRTSPSFSAVARENWLYGRWALASAIFMWVPWNIFYTLVASFSGMSQAGQLRALLNFALPMAQTYGAMSLLFIPHAARTLNDEGPREIAKVSNRVMLLFLAFGAAYWTAVFLFRQPLLHLLYAGQYSDVATYLPAIGLASILWGCAQGPAIALRSNKTPYLVFHMYFGAAIVALAAGISLTRSFGLMGASYAMLLASAAAWLIGLYCIRRAARPGQALSHQAA